MAGGPDRFKLDQRLWTRHPARQTGSQEPHQLESSPLADLPRPPAKLTKDLSACARPALRHVTVAAFIL